MDLEEYYLPGCERNIIENQSQHITEELMRVSSRWNVIELGAGDGSKTLHFLQKLAGYGVEISYVALDISDHVLRINGENMSRALPDMPFTAVPGNYYRTYHRLSRQEHNLILFMGSNIGNYTEGQAVKFLHWLSAEMSSRDRALVAFDLKKHPRTILRAYDDAQGITRAFNLNILERINRELEGNFAVHRFDHYPYYEPISGMAYSYLVSLEDQTAVVANTAFRFGRHELIHTEISKKYSLAEIDRIARTGGLSTLRHYIDIKSYYALSLLECHDYVSGNSYDRG